MSTTIWLLMGLLLLSYMGSFITSGRTVRGVGLPSGTEYVILGFVIGPEALGLLERSTVDLFEPVADVTVGWLCFVLGLTYGVSGTSRVRAGRVFGGCFIALFTGACVGAAAWAFLTLRGELRPDERIIAATGAGAVSAETTRYAVRWIVERYGARGPLADLIGDLADCDDLVPLLAVAFVFALRPNAPLALPIAVPFYALAGMTIGLGILLGAIAALLLGDQFEVAEAWGVLLGISMLVIGMADRLGFSPVAAMFAMGVALSAITRHRPQICAMVMPTERAVLLPSLLLAGAHVHFGATPYLPLFVAACVGARVVAKLLVGVGLFAISKPARRAGPALGAGLLSAGALAMAIGLTFALRFPGKIGDLVLACAAVVTIFGEVTGPASLRSLLRRAGEITDDKRDKDAPLAEAPLAPTPRAAESPTRDPEPSTP